MSETHYCPDLDSWRSLFCEALPADKREYFRAHLESCPSCQALLDAGEDSHDPILSLARQLGDPTAAPSDSRIVEFMDRVLDPERPAPLEPEDLYFLRPADRPGVIGMLGDYEVRAVLGQGGMGVVLK